MHFARRCSHDRPTVVSELFVSGRKNYDNRRFSHTSWFYIGPRCYGSTSRNYRGKCSTRRGEIGKRPGSYKCIRTCALVEPRADINATTELKRSSSHPISNRLWFPPDQSIIIEKSRFFFFFFLNRACCTWTFFT